MNVRRATVHDVPALLAIKHALRFTGSSQGGFLLGSDEEEYRQRVDEGQVWVLETRSEVQGFAVTLGSAAFSKSPLWELRHQVRWGDLSTGGLTERVGYFDQLAVKRGTPARAAMLLAFVALWNLLAIDRQVVTTTVVGPVRNQAAVPLIQLVGGVYAGELDEAYPGIGRLTSGIWVIAADATKERVLGALRSSQPSVLSAIAGIASRTGVADLTALLHCLGP